MTEPKKTKEEKEAEKEAKVIAKIIDEKDDNFCGFCAFNVIDQDGYNKMIKGCNVEGPLFAEHVGSKVVISANFTPKPHGYLSIQRDNQLYVNGSLWYGDAKKSPTNLIGRIVPKQMELIAKEMEKAGDSCTEFDCKFEIPFLKGAAKRLATMKFDTVEERFQTKIVGLKVELSEADWMEWKQYKLKFWKIGKAAGASTEAGGDDEDKEKDKKEE